MSDLLNGALDSEQIDLLLSLDDGEGAVLAESPVAVPLFGPPTNARVDHVTENGKPAAVGFEGDHWFVVTPADRRRDTARPRTRPNLTGISSTSSSSASIPLSKMSRTA